MKFSSVSAAILAALSAVQAAPLSKARSSDLALDHKLTVREPGRTVGEIFAEREKEANEKGIAIDRKLKARGRTVGEIFAEREKEANEKGIAIDRKLKARGRTVGEIFADEEKLANEKGESLD
ncbi:hypothetical protein LZ30DRAFT_694916 [Colletotrichum cereale]|nr:hypothetical protein LZ30DRAFT_694916 [Colletotrichum cereale]